MYDTKKQKPSSVSRRASSLLRRPTRSRSDGTSTRPNARVHTKNTANEPSDFPAAASDVPPPVASPVTRAITPTHRMSSNIAVPNTYFTNGRRLQPSSSNTFATRVVDESQMAAPRKTDGSTPQ